MSDGLSRNFNCQELRHWDSDSREIPHALASVCKMWSPLTWGCEYWLQARYQLVVAVELAKPGARNAVFQHAVRERASSWRTMVTGRYSDVVS